MAGLTALGPVLRQSISRRNLEGDFSESPSGMTLRPMELWELLLSPFLLQKRDLWGLESASPIIHIGKWMQRYKRPAVVAMEIFDRASPLQMTCSDGDLHASSICLPSEPTHL